MSGYAQGIITTVAGGGLGGDGSLATDAYLDEPNDVYLDDTGNIYIATNYKIRKVTASTGIISTLAGDGTGGVGCDGCDATQAKFWGAYAIAFDKYGNYYIADKANHAIRKVDAATNIISIVAGNWTLGYSGDGGPATSAQLSNPVDICLDTSGNLYIADQDYVIRKVDEQTGNISTVAGDGVQGTWSEGDIAVNAHIGAVLGICVDKQGNIYFTDAVNRKIGKINSAGVLSTYCGTGMFGIGGDDGLAVNAQTFASTRIRMDRNGNMYYGDGAVVVRRIDYGTGIITRVVGNGIAGFSGDNGPALQAQLTGPVSTWLDTNNNLVIADHANLRIRKVTGIVGIPEVPESVNLMLFPNPSDGQFLVTSENTIKYIEVRDLIGHVVYRENSNKNSTPINIAGNPDGVYIVSVHGEKGLVCKKVILHR